MSSLGQLVVSLAANTAAFQADLGKAAHEAAKQAEKMAKGFAVVGLAIDGVQKSAKLLYHALGGELVKQSIDTADRMGKMAQSAGISVDKFSQLAYAAEFAGVGAQELSGVVSKLNRSIVEAKDGVGPAALAFEDLGIKVKNADGSLKSAEVVMGELSERFKNAPDGPEKTAAALILMGRGAATSIPFLNQGADAIKRAAEESDYFGTTVRENSAKAAEQFNDTIRSLTKAKDGLAMKLMEAVIPSLNEFAKSMLDGAKNAENMKIVVGAVEGVVKGTLTAIVGITAAIRVFGDSIAKLAFAATLLLEKGGVGKALKLLKEDSADMASVIENAMITIQRLWGEAGDAVVISADRQVKANQIVLRSTTEVAAAIAAAKKAEEEARRAAAKALQDELEMYAKAAMFRAKFMEEAEAEGEAAGIKQMQETEAARVLMMQQGLEAREALREQEDAAILESHRTRMALVAEELRITAMGWRVRATTVMGEMAKMTAGVAQHSRAMFEINKIAGIANVALAIPETVADAYKFGNKWGGPVAGAAMAAVALAAQIAQLSAIKSTTFGSGGAAPSIVGSTPAPPVSPVAAAPARSAPETRVIVMTSNPMQRQFLEELADSFKELAADGYPMPFELAEAR